MFDKPKEHDPKFRGPIEDRSCTDIICCLIFVVFILAFLLVGLWAFAMGDIRVLIFPTDSSGNVCGSGDQSDKPVLFFFDLMTCARDVPLVLATMKCPTPSVCLESCPDGNFVWLQAENDPNQRKNLICQYNVDPTLSTQSVHQLVSSETCAPYYLASDNVGGRCLPISILEDIINATEQLYDKNNNAVNSSQLVGSVTMMQTILALQQTGIRVIQDFQACWKHILFFFGLSMLISLLWIVIMRWITGPLIFVTILLFVASFGFAVYYCFTKYLYLKMNPIETGPVVFSTDVNYYTNLYQTWLVFGIASAVILGIMLLVLLVLRNRIFIAIALIKEGSRAVGCMMSTLFWPIVPFILQLLLLGYWLGSAVFLAATSKGHIVGNRANLSDAETGYLQAKGDISEAFAAVFQTASMNCNSSDNSTGESICEFATTGGNKYTIYLQFFQIFMWFWLMNFIIGLGQMTLSGAFASYYWAFHKPKDIPSCPLASSLGRALRYHVGSLAFGSLIIAIVQMIRVLLEYADSKLKGSENAVAKFVLKCMQCFFWCLEKFLKFINRNAYIMIAIYGKNFCTSAKDAFFLILRNIVRVAVLNCITDFLIFICKLFIVGSIGAFSFFYFNQSISEVTDELDQGGYVDLAAPQLHYFYLPVIVNIIGAFVVASLFFSVYSMAVDTLFLCFLEDLERNDGTPEKPYYMNKELSQILGKKNKKVPESPKTETSKIIEKN